MGGNIIREFVAELAFVSCTTDRISEKHLFTTVLGEEGGGGVDGAAGLKCLAVGMSVDGVFPKQPASQPSQGVP